MKHIDIVFDGPPGPESGRFVEVEDDTGASIRFGEWVEQDAPPGHQRYWALRLPAREEWVLQVGTSEGVTDWSNFGANEAQARATYRVARGDQPGVTFYLVRRLVHEEIVEFKGASR